MAEVAEASGVPVPILSETTRSALREMIPDYLTVDNPVDNGAQFLVTNPVEDRRRVFDLIVADPDVDVIVIGLTGALGRLTDRFADDIVAFADEISKPIVVTWNSFKTDEKGFKTLIDAGIPMFRSFRNCFAALRNFARYEEASSSFRARKKMSTKLPASRRRRAVGSRSRRWATRRRRLAPAARGLRRPPGRGGPGPLGGRGRTHWPRPSAFPWS